VSPSRLKDLEDKEVKECLVAMTQTDLGMDEIDRLRSRASDDSKGSRRVGGGGRVSKQGRLSKQETDVDELNKDSRFLNQNSSTAMGTNQHGQSLHIDTIDAGLKHNTSLEQ